MLAASSLFELDKESKMLSKRLNKLLYNEVVEWCRYDKCREELVIRFLSGRTLFIDNISDKYDISING
jgi:hypothetical protein